MVLKSRLTIGGDVLRKIVMPLITVMIAAVVLTGCSSPKPADVPAANQKSTINPDTINQEAAKEKHPEGN
jgi:hypothetical protein